MFSQSSTKGKTLISQKRDHELELKELAILSQKGDKQAYAQFLKSLSPYIHGAIRKKIGSITDSEDLVQECLMGIHRNLSSYQPDQPIKPWISAIIRYKLADHFRRLSRRKEQLVENESELVTNQQESTNNKGVSPEKEASEILDALPEKLKRTLEMTHIEGLSYSEAAKKQGISEAALRKRISRAFAQVRKIVAKDQEFLN